MKRETHNTIAAVIGLVLFSCPFLGWIDWHTFWFVFVAMWGNNLARAYVDDHRDR